MTRKQVLDSIYHPGSSTDGVREAWRVRETYLAEHPDDQEIIEAGEMLYMLGTALGMPDGGATLRSEEPVVASR